MAGTVVLTGAAVAVLRRGGVELVALPPRVVVVVGRAEYVVRSGVVPVPARVVLVEGRSPGPFDPPVAVDDETAAVGTELWPSGNPFGTDVGPLTGGSAAEAPVVIGPGLVAAGAVVGTCESPAVVGGTERCPGGTCLIGRPPSV